MKLTERDLEILRFINDCGYCVTPHLVSFLSVKRARIYQIMKRLVHRKLVIKEPLLHGHPSTYYLTVEGAKFTELPAIEFISLGTYRHQVAMINVALKLMRIYPEATWISERHLIYDKFCEGIGKRGHVADGLLVFPDKRQIAIEVELSVKGRRRIEGILKSYSSNFEIKEVWYFCSPYAYTVLSDIAAKKSYIKIFSIKEFLL